MKARREKIDFSIIVLGIILMGLIFAITMKTLPLFANDGSSSSSNLTPSDDGQHFVTIYDNGIAEKQTIKTDASTVEDVLARAGINLEVADIVEPSKKEPIVSESFNINIYRAKPALVIDDQKHYKIMTAASTPAEIVASAGIDLLEADVVKITTQSHFLESGLPIAYSVLRAKTISFNFYGQPLNVRTTAISVDEFLKERQITLSESDWVSEPLDTEITEGLQLMLYRQGVNTVTTNEQIPFTEQITHDYSLNIGTRIVSRPGEVGSKTVTYEIEMADGVEISRRAISEIITKEPLPQQVTLGARAITMKALTKAMGRNRYTTSTGILRMETYYDLDMVGVMQIKQRECGGSATYSVRADGVKIDEDGFVIVAAALNRYPRCSVVETSLGLGKVYDTGSFADHNPEQFDIATDWTKRDGI